MVKSVTSSKPIADIAFLHTGGEIDVDLTWGEGGIYRGTTIKPKIRIDQREGGDIQADLCNGILLPDRSAKSIVFDLPFVVRRNWDKSDHYIFRKYCGFHTKDEARKFYYTVILDAKRVLKRYGFLIVKIQDSSLKDGGTFWAAQEVFQMAIASGYIAVDQFIEIAPVPKPLPANVKRQQKARKIHCTWWVFKKL